MLVESWSHGQGSYRDALYVLELDVAKGNQTVVLVVFLWQLQHLSGFTPLGIVETHRPREVNKNLQLFRSLSWRGQRREIEQENTDVIVVVVGIVVILD